SPSHLDIATNFPLSTTLYQVYFPEAQSYFVLIPFTLTRGSRVCPGDVTEGGHRQGKLVRKPDHGLDVLISPSRILVGRVLRRHQAQADERKLLHALNGSAHPSRLRGSFPSVALQI
ncbi:hypothetical protein DICSQDRAFT_141736, partial [Dichomitus squalens LYAD-421 SS1]